MPAPSSVAQSLVCLAFRDLVCGFQPKAVALPQRPLRGYRQTGAGEADFVVSLGDRCCCRVAQHRQPGALIWPSRFRWSPQYLCVHQTPKPYLVTEIPTRLCKCTGSRTARTVYFTVVSLFYCRALHEGVIFQPVSSPVSHCILFLVSLFVLYLI